MKEIQIERCREKDIDGLRQFIDTYWRRRHVLSRDASLLRWQFASGRAQPSAFERLSILPAWHGDRIVGMLGLIYFDLNIKGMVIPGVWLSHWLAIPESRAQDDFYFTKSDGDHEIEEIFGEQPRHCPSGTGVGPRSSPDRSNSSNLDRCP